jgi:hypothetical protein
VPYASVPAPSAVEGCLLSFQFPLATFPFSGAVLIFTVLYWLFSQAIVLASLKDKQSDKENGHAQVKNAFRPGLCLHREIKRPAYNNGLQKKAQPHKFQVFRFYYFLFHTNLLNYKSLKCNPKPVSRDQWFGVRKCTAAA